MDFETSVVFNIDSYLKDIDDSYHNNWADTWYQFLLDAPRMKILLDNTPVTDPCDFYVKVKCNRDIIRICTQAGMYFTYMTLWRQYTDGRDLHLVDGSTNHTVVSITGTRLNIDRSFTLKYCDTNVEVSTVHSVMDIDLSQMFGILSWNHSCN
jgi:hypothetical protein